VLGHDCIGIAAKVANSLANVGNALFKARPPQLGNRARSGK
jgi:hypothetical protein